jgi:hypothetical protein
MLMVRRFVIQNAVDKLAEPREEVVNSHEGRFGVVILASSLAQGGEVAKQKQTAND